MSAKTERQSDACEIKPWRSNKGEDWVALTVTRDGQQVYAATCWDQADAEAKRDLWIAGAPVDVIDYGPTRERDRWLA